MSVFNNNFLSGKISLVTGSSRGIGREIALNLAKHGSYVFINYFKADKSAMDLKHEINQFGGNCQLLKFDVSDSNDVKASVENISKEFKKIDILVNNAGIARAALALRFKEEDFDEVMKVNVKGHFNCIKYCLPLLLRSDSPSIVNLSSVLGITGDLGNSVYSTSKSAILGLTKSIALEYASKGLRANCIAPGFIKTDMTALVSEEVSKIVLSKIPLKFQGEPIEIANCVLFLVSDAAKYITGQTISVDGGMVMK
ncbi:SDR family oxidoreductase [Fluviispira sanaruensis]|uniref:3-oxoacyl-[acyl-carrier-protein] reductase n=1 Tax=Fluviispira sanaruensis TaxID=2493639 RepID=A0A4P2VR28_FLUSA|nr:SDR family NAD(P)-dependent oxidoreductase [Fluviispira sanaruensis]BBH54619.1 3-oxoacyl-[acyl-carrier-protein] reductase [Fluviispira sanaruensis]